MCAHHKELFTKRAGKREADRDPMYYPQRSKSPIADRLPNIWNDRIPMKRGTFVFKQKRSKEKKFNKQHHLMASKNNEFQHRYEREYFDRPFAATYGSGFKQIYIKPHVLTEKVAKLRLKSQINNQMSQASTEADSPMPNIGHSTLHSSFKRRTSAGLTQKLLPIVTNGLADLEIDLLQTVRSILPSAPRLAPRGLCSSLPTTRHSS